MYQVHLLKLVQILYYIIVDLFPNPLGSWIVCCLHLAARLPCIRDKNSVL